MAAMLAEYRDPRNTGFTFIKWQFTMAPMTSTEERHIDLHIHSNCSDGAFSAYELVDLAVREGLTAIAIADHDSVASVPAGISAAALAGIENIPAVELSVQYRSYRDVHLLGYGLDHTDEQFRGKLDELRIRRERRIEDVLARVNESLVFEGRPGIGLSRVVAYAKGAIGRPHIARALMERGYVKSVEEAFRRYLVPCNVPKRYWPMDDAIAEIRRIGGLAVLAHPTTVSSDHQELRRIVTELSGMGLDGIEVYNNLALPDDMEFLRRRAVELGLLITGGSDYHGIELGIEIGRGRGGIRFSADLLPPLRERLAERHKQISRSR